MAARKQAAPPAAEARRALGRARPDGQAMFPVAPPKSDLPSGYGDALSELKARIQQARLHIVLAANAAMLQLYWDMGRTILARQAREGWGAKVIDRLSADLRQAFPDMSGLSPRNLTLVEELSIRTQKVQPLMKKMEQMAARMDELERQIEAGRPRQGSRDDHANLQVELRCLHGRQEHPGQQLPGLGTNPTQQSFATHHLAGKYAHDRLVAQGQLTRRQRPGEGRLESHPLRACSVPGGVENGDTGKAVRFGNDQRPGSVGEQVSGAGAVPRV